MRISDWSSDVCSSDLARLTRDVDRAEELAQEALLSALTDWPASGVPKRPGAWLMAAAKRRAIDGFRRAAMQDRKHAESARAQDVARDISSKSVQGQTADQRGLGEGGLGETCCGRRGALGA